MKKNYTLEEAVLKYGSEAQISMFNKIKSESKKKKGNLKADQFKSLVTSIKQHYECVDIDGKGADRHIVCDGERNEIIDRKELQNYSNSGNRNQLPYKDDIREAVLHHLEQTNKITTTHRSMLKDLGIIDSVFDSASSVFDAESQKKFYNSLDDKYKSHGYHMFWDVVGYEYGRLVSNLKSVLNSLSDSKIIRYNEVINAVVVDENGKEEHQMLHPIIGKEIELKRMELRTKHDITMRDVLYKPKDKKEKIKMYQKEEKEYLELLGYSYVYDAIQVYIVATEKEITKYFNKAKEIKEKHLQYAYELAMKREEDYVNSLLEQLGGKRKPQHAINDKLTRQEMIGFEKQSGTYADNYKETLKNVNNVE